MEVFGFDHENTKPTNGCGPWSPFLRFSCETVLSAPLRYLQWEQSMSRQNKTNKTNYTQRGRLTPDDMARERMNQDRITGRAKGNVAEKGRASAGRAPSRPRSVPEERD